MKVLHVIDSLDVGGAEQLVARLALAPERTFDMTVVALRSWDTPTIPDKLRAAGVPFELFELTTGGVGLRPRPTALVRYLRFVRTGRFDVVHTHVNSSHILGLVTALCCRIRWVVTLHSVRAGAASWKERLRMALIRHRADGVIAVGRTVADDHADDLGSRAAVVIPNPAPRPGSDEIRPRDDVRVALDVPLDSVLLVAVGRLAAQKDHGLLLDAMVEVHRAAPGVRVLVAGPGRRYDELTARARSLGLDDVVRFLGPRDDVPDLLGAADGFVSSSAWEGMPLSILEAMGRGLPVVATAVGDCREVVGDAGLLVEPGDAAALTEAILTLVTDVDLRNRCGALARRRAEDEFGVAAWVERLQAQYDAVTTAD